jgi:[glutamine synthetase] adenylyltransferase / [glutamine synthetase]-adenylyl-L-tyrosine phosphorylase
MSGIIPPRTIDLPSYSRYVARITRRYSEYANCLSIEVPDKEQIQACLNTLLTRHELSVSLRITRHLVLKRLIEIDCTSNASVQTITTAMTALAEIALQAAYDESFIALKAIHGTPLTPQA